FRTSNKKVERVDVCLKVGESQRARARPKKAGCNLLLMLDASVDFVLSPAEADATVFPLGIGSTRGLCSFWST
ncbi:MAG: hypothetical protein AB8A35_07380, partial [Prochlorococcus sp.]